MSGSPRQSSPLGNTLILVASLSGWSRTAWPAASVQSQNCVQTLSVCNSKYTSDTARYCCEFFLNVEGLHVIADHCLSFSFVEFMMTYRFQVIISYCLNHIAIGKQSTILKISIIYQVLQITYMSKTYVYKQYKVSDITQQIQDSWRDKHTDAKLIRKYKLLLERSK